MAWEFETLKKHSDFGKFSLSEKNINPDPIEQFALWFAEAEKSGIPDPNAMALSTVSADGKPTARILLLKDFSPQGFVFFTNYESRKGRDLENNPNASLLFFWQYFERQVRIDGVVSKLPYEGSDEYYQTRPYTSRLGAWASKQSQPLKSRFTLMRQVAALTVKYPVKPPCPPFWGGYSLSPHTIEFWQGRENRLHDRFQFEKKDNIWIMTRLYP